MTEERTVKFMKDVLLNGTEPRGKEAENNLKWGLQEYLKEQLILYGVSISLPKLQIGDKIKLYGKETTVTGFEANWNDALEPPRYEIILLTIGRGDPFYRSLDSIELLGNEY